MCRCRHWWDTQSRRHNAPSLPNDGIQEALLGSGKCTCLGGEWEACLVITKCSRCASSIKVLRSGEGVGGEASSGEAMGGEASSGEGVGGAHTSCKHECSSTRVSKR